MDFRLFQTVELFQALRAALLMHVKFAYDNGYSVSSAVFPFVAMDPVVRRRLSATEAGLQEVHRDWVRHILCFDFPDFPLHQDVLCSDAQCHALAVPAFQRQHLCFVSVRDLLVCASGRWCGFPSCRPGTHHCGKAWCFPAIERARAIRVLRRWFVPELLAWSRAAGKPSENVVECLQGWQAELERCDGEGMYVRSRVCCYDAVYTRVSLDSFSKPLPVCVPLAPWPRSASCELPGVFSRSLGEERRRLAAYASGGFNHDAALFPLPCDFLCSTCQWGFMQFSEHDLQALAPEACLTWCRQMQLRASQLQAKEALIAQWRAAMHRRRLAELLRESACPHTELSRLRSFQAEVQSSAGACDAAIVEKLLRRAQLAACCPEEYRVDPVEQGVVCQRVPFGIMKRRPGDSPSAAGTRVTQELWWSRAVSFVDYPVRWLDYSGKPDFVPVPLWCARSWVRCRGGFASVSLPVQQWLLSLEGQHNPLYTFAMQPGPSPPRFEALVELCPGGFPGLDV